MFKKIALALVLLIAAILIFAATRPDTFRVERSTTIQASPEKIFANVNDFHQWPSWSPWQRLDPSMAVSYSGAPAGPGAVYEWEGNKKVGKGRMEITNATDQANVKIKLDFLQPFESHNTTDFLFEPAGSATKVTWVMYGPSPYMTKVMGIFMSMDSMIGGDFERGLANLKAVSEKS